MGVRPDAGLVGALVNGDEAAFHSLVQANHGAMVRIAMAYVPGRAVAEEVVQETWLAVFRGIRRFEGRSSLTTWIYRILVNCARTRGARERRTVPMSQLGHREEEPSVDADRFLPRDHSRWPDHWAIPPKSWDLPEERLLSLEVRRIVEETVRSLPPAQRKVLVLRDMEGWSAAETCNVLEIGESNQRVLLHRARSKVRGALERYFSEG